MTQHVGQHCLQLQHSELLSNAVPRTGAEGDVGIGVSLCYPLWQEVVRVKLLGVWELDRISMDSVDVRDHCASRRDVIARWKREQKYCYLYVGHCKLRNHTAVEDVCRLSENTLSTVDVTAAGIVE